MRKKNNIKILTQINLRIKCVIIFFNNSAFKIAQEMHHK
jgi:hypothetical protein